jgi:hypothetical protein
MQVLERMQGILERTYDLENAHRVTEFLVTCPDFARSYGLEPDSARGTERVLVDGGAQNLGLSVYLDAGVVEHLDEHDPLSSLHDGNLDAFWTALEGVSHFVYLIWNASRSKPVTRLELELQAEVDKFVTTALLVAAQQEGRVPTELHTWLFDVCRLDEGLDEDEADRYAKANRYAGRYCLALARRYLRRGAGSMFPEIRRFYRLTQRGKLRRIVAGP